MKAIFAAMLGVVLSTAIARAQPPAMPHKLDENDVNAWLDGFVPNAIGSGQIAGAVVVVVRDSQVLTERGFGFADVALSRPVDPERTLFRPGSISKLFTWTAVMQLVHAGKLDLARDVNTYLDFRIPDAFDAPITLRDLMTHTAGFEETYKGLVTHAPDFPAPLRAALKAWVPTRIFAPGRVPAYSNYGAGLAGYIVERVSGEPFADYMTRHILRPLGMVHSTFDQPLPPSLAADMSRGYDLAGRPPGAYELVSLTPAGALASSGADMARFMIAHLQGGRLGDAQILDPATAKLMHATAFTPVASMPGMALGFYHEDRNGQNIIGHRGNSEQFHSDLHLFLDRGVGLYISMNSAGNESAAHLRDRFLNDFVDRYFPAPPVTLGPNLASAGAHAAMIAGRYFSSRRSADTFLSVANLFDQREVLAGADGTLMTSLDDAATHWREVAPFLWREMNGRATLGAVVSDNRVVAFMTDDRPPVAVFQRVPGWLNAGWNIPLLLLSLTVIALTAVGWPIAAVLRRFRARPLAQFGARRTLYRFARITAAFDLLFCVGWTIVIARITSDVTAMNAGLDPWIRLVQFIGVVGVAGSLAALTNAVVVLRDASARWWRKGSEVLIAISCVAFVWFAFLLHLISTRLNY